MEMKTNDLLLFLQGLLNGGWKEKDRIIRKCTPTSGAIYLHKRYIGQKFDVYLIPVKDNDSPKVEEAVKKAEESLKKNLKELKA